MISLSIFLLAAAALRAGGLVCFIVQSAPFIWATRARKFQFFGTIACFSGLLFDLILLPSGLGGMFIPWCEAPLHASNRSIKNENICSIAWFLSICWLAAAALRAGGYVYFMVQSTPSCKQRELENFENLCSIAACFPCLFFDLLLLPSGQGGLLISWCKAPLHASDVS